MKAIEEYVRSLGLDAYLVGGAVRDELLGRDSKDADFLVPGVDSESLRAAQARASSAPAAIPQTDAISSTTRTSREGKARGAPETAWTW